MVMGVSMSSLHSRDEIIPTRQALSTFPLKIGDWRGSEIGLERAILDELKLDDYVLASFSDSSRQYPIELYIAYYGSQRKGASVHSPKACLPGGGWKINQFDQYRVADVGPFGEGLDVNRSVISMGKSRQLVYYWFQQRGRIITNEYLVKWYIFWDAITMNRSDGALVRLVTAVPETADIAEYDARLQEFLRTVDPQLSYYLPGKLAEPSES
jgi:EpsI family protein